MFLIMSAAYVGQELQSEFGKIPPSFLPLGNKRLFQHQISLAPNKAEIFLSIPESFTLADSDKALLDASGVNLIYLPEDLPIGASLVTALNISGKNLDSPLHVLYGDTLFSKLPVGNDIVSFSEGCDGYKRAIFTEDIANWLEESISEKSSYPQHIIDGYFKFENSRALVKYISQNNWDFIKGLNCYHKNIGLTSVKSEGWLDFGHVNSYYLSKAAFTTQRAFNELKITDKWIEKSSYKNTKIAAEANWFETLPLPLRGYTPQFLGSRVSEGKVSYRLEYLHLTALNELFVFAKLPSHIWIKILSSCMDFLLECAKFKSKSTNKSSSLDDLLRQKTEERLSEFCAKNKITLDEEWVYNNDTKVSIKDILNYTDKYLPKNILEDSIYHGDFCFSNILYDFRANKIKTIDPRGMSSNGEVSSYGSLLYDVAKLSHSIIGLYDWIIAGYFKVNIIENEITFEITERSSTKNTQKLFVQMVESNFNLSINNLYAMQIHLFLSMLPLHSDNQERQKGLFANVFRLYKTLLRGNL